MSKQQAVRIIQQQMHSIATEAQQALPELNGWIKCSDRLPDENVHVLISNSEGIEVACLIPASEDGPDCMGHDAGWCGMVSFPGRSFGNPRYFYEAQGQATHWMPLPAPPTE